MALATGAWLDLQVVKEQTVDVHRTPTVLTSDLGTWDLAQATIGHTALVRIARFDGPAPAVSVHTPPPGIAAHPRTGTGG